MKEIWRTIKNFPDYKVSNTGIVKSYKCNRERVLKQCINNRGYYAVGLTKNKKPYAKRVHQLVAIAFLNHIPCGNKVVVDHKDNNQLNNHATNLQLTTNRVNTSKDRKNGTSKYIGVSWNKNAKKWHSQIYVNGKLRHLGVFTTEVAAHQAYKNALDNINGFSFNKALG